MTASIYAADGVTQILAGAGISITPDVGMGTVTISNLYAEGAGVTAFNSRTGLVTLTSADIVSALGYTPANSTDFTGYATIASPNFTGNPTAPTPTVSDNTTKLATTAFVKAVAQSGLTTGSALLAGDGNGGIGNVTIGSGLSYSAGTLSASGGSGTVTSVAATAPTGLSVSGSPITTSGTLALTWATTPTGTGANVFATSPSLVTPTLDSINGGATAGWKNRCLNGMMEVSQRGDYTTASASTNTTYYLDRWYTDHNIACNKQQTTGNSITNLGASCKAFKLIATASGSGYIGMVQKYEWFSELSGKQVTLSAYVKSNSVNARVFWTCATTGQLVASSAHTGGGGWEKLTAYATVTAGLTTFQMCVYLASAAAGATTITSGDYIEATGFQLKAGDCRNELYNEWRPYAIEEMLCQRYYYRVFDSSLFMLPAFSQRVVSNLIDTPLAHPVIMRASPTFSSSSPSYAASPSGNQIGFYDNVAGNYSSITGTVTLSSGSSSTSSFLLRLTASTSFGSAAGAMGNLYIGSGGWYALSAELS